MEVLRVGPNILTFEDDRLLVQVSYTLSTSLLRHCKQIRDKGSPLIWLADDVFGIGMEPSTHALGVVHHSTTDSSAKSLGRRDHRDSVRLHEGEVVDL